MNQLEQKLDHPQDVARSKVSELKSRGNVRNVAEFLESRADEVKSRVG